MSLTVFVTFGDTRLSEMVRQDQGGHPIVVTAVARAASGMVGFDLPEAALLLRRLLVGSVSMEQSNSPAYRIITTEQEAVPFGPRFVVCTSPSESLLDAFHRIETNRKLESQNRILNRHGRPPRTIVPTVLDGLVDDDDRFSSAAIEFLLENCRSMSIWGHSEFGLYAGYLGHSRQSAALVLETACEELRVPIRTVESQRELPVW